MKTESEPVLEMPVSGGFDSDNIAFCINQFDKTAPGQTTEQNFEQKVRGI